MTNPQDIRRYSDAIMAMIKEDQDSGQVPREVSSWDELDDSVDTEDYCRRALLPAATGRTVALRDAVTSDISHRLSGALGGPWHVMWTHPGGAPLEISRTIGYATKAEAEEVGREYLAVHGGSFHVHDT
jgi:hypothetical protein